MNCIVPIFCEINMLIINFCFENNTVELCKCEHVKKRVNICTSQCFYEIVKLDNYVDS